VREAAENPEDRAPKVKICGVTTPADARLAVELGADLIGLNFHAPSPRCVTPSQGRDIASAVAGRAKVVGVFVNRPTEELKGIVETVPLDLIQFHGDEGPEEIEPWGRRALKVFRIGDSFEPDRLARYPGVWGFLFDCRDEEVYGGSGRSWNYDTIAGLDARGKPVLLAGGLKPENVRAALQRSGADGVDVCSGVEKAPGVKDAELLRWFFREVNHETRE